MIGERSSWSRIRQRDVPREAGLTLVEIVVVFAIMGIVVAVTLPQLQALLGDPVDDVVGELTSAHLAAREAAAERGVAMTTVLELATGAYWVISLDEASSARDTIRSGTLRLKGEVRLSGGRAGWALTSFDRLGRARGMPLLVSGPKRTYEISVDPWTGAIDASPR